MQSNVVRNLTVRGQSQGLEKVKSDLDGVSAAQAKVSQTGETMARTTDTAGTRMLSAAAKYDRWLERNDRMAFALRQQQREMQLVKRAFEAGHIDMTQHAQAVALVEAKYQRLVAAEAAARTQMAATTAATETQTAAMVRLAAANENGGFQTANIAAQFQDIGVTTAMGMNPIMIALQQGTQLSAVLNTMQNPLQGMATAFMSIINPVSLLTIGFIALTAATVQFFMASNDNADTAADALEEHSKWLDATLKGYEGARKAAQDYIDTALKLPEASLNSELSTQRDSMSAVFSQRLVELREQRMAFATEVASMAEAGGDLSMIAGMQNVLDVVAQAGLTANSSAEQFAKLDTSLTLIKNSNADDNVVFLAEQMLKLMRDAGEARAQVESLTAALNAVPGNVTSTISVRMEAFGDAQADLAKLMPDFRDRYTKMRDDAQEAYERMRANATDGILRLAADQDLQRVLGGIDRLEREDNARKAARAGKSELEKMGESYASITQQSRQFIAGQQLAAETIGMTAEAAAKLRFEQDMLNKAANDNIALGPQQRSEIAGLAAEMAAAEERARSMNEVYATGQSATRGFLSDMMGYLRQGPAGWQNFGDVARTALEGAAKAAQNLIDKMADRALSGIADMIWDWGAKSFMPKLGGGGPGYLGGGADSWGPKFPNALGNVFQSPSLSAYSNQIHETPKLFQFAKGIGEFAEAGPEAIMPLGRDGAGRLGVRVANGNGDGAANSNVRVEVHNYSGQPVRQEQTKGPDGVDITRIIIGAVNTAIADGRLDGSMRATYGLSRKGN